MEYIFMFIFFLVGMMVASFTVIPVFIILFFGIPTTSKLERKGLLKKTNGIKKGYMLNLLIFPIVYLGILWAINSFFPSGAIGYYIGTGAALLFGFGQTGTNRNNVSDYFESNKRNFTASQEEVLKAVLTR